MAFKTRTSQYMPVTFVCDTGVPMFIYINEITRRLISDRIQIDDSENEFIMVNDKKMSVHDSPSNHPDVNILGIRALSYFGLKMDYEDFDFERLPKYYLNMRIVGKTMVHIMYLNIDMNF